MMNYSNNKKKRLEGIDLARFLAFTGMVIANFKIVMGVEIGSGFLFSFTEFLQGKAAATFVVLAGLSLNLTTKSLASNQSFTVIIKRAIFLLIIGLLNSLIFEADILHYYAFYFLIGFFMLSLPSRSLVGLIVLINIIFVTMIFTLDYDRGWIWEELAYTDFWTLQGFIRNLFFNGWHPVFPWLSFLFLGFLLSRLRLNCQKVQLMLTVSGALLLICVELISIKVSDYLYTLDPALVDLVTTAPIPPMPLYILAGIGSASMIIGMCLILEKWLKNSAVFSLTVPAGQQTLTLYIAHIIIGMTILDALGLRSGQTVENVLIYSIGFCSLAALYASFWKRFFKRGPLEMFLRKLSGK